MKKTPPDYQIMIVPRGTAPRWRMGWMVLLAALWAASLGGVWLWASEIAAPGLLQSRIQAHEAQTALSALQQQVGTLSQRETTLGRSDQISRQANTDLQNALAQRDEEIASLRADVAFYERLVGPTAQRQGLNVHSAEFSPAGGTAWHYRITLVQNRDRNLISAGQMRFTVEGTQAGRPVTLDWSQFQAQPAATGQTYSFRYFQQLEGSVSLPEGFEPHRVRISLIAGSGANVERDFDWKASGP